jgi:hypothetical protein
MRALPILAIVLAIGAVVQELRPSSTGSPGSRTASAAAADQVTVTPARIVTRMPANDSARAGLARALVGFHAYIVPQGGLVALVDLDDLAGAEQSLRQSKGERTVTVELIGVEGLHGVQRETLEPRASSS